MQNENENSILKLVNPEFDFEFMGKVYTVRKATLDKAVQYRVRAQELIKAEDPVSDPKLVAYCIYLILKDKDSEITEEFVLQNTPADIDFTEVLTKLGFLRSSKA